MDENRYITLLEEHDVKPTANRLIVLRTLDAAGRPMSLSELEYKILTIDKSGIFRTLSLFREQHLVAMVCAMSYATVITTVLTMICTSTFIVNNAKRPTVLTISQCLMSTCQKASSCRLSTIW